MKDKIEELIALFALMPEWLDRYNYLVELGSILPPMPVAFKVSENRITCNSMLYFYVYYSENTCYIEAQANTAIPQGLAALMYTVCNGYTQQEIYQNFPLFESFLDEFGFQEHLTITRGKALFEMLLRIKKSYLNILL